MATRRHPKTQHARHITRRRHPEGRHLLRSNVRKRSLPVLGATMAGGAGLAIASIVGAGELIIGATAAYVTYRIFQRNR